MKKILIWAFGVLLILAGALFFFSARYADRVVDPYVRSLLEQNKPMHHRVDYKKIRLNLITRSIHIRDVRMVPDSGYAKDENIWLDISVGLIKLNDFRLWEMLFHKNLVIGDFVILNPEVDVHLPLEVTTKTVEEVTEDTVRKEKSQLLKNISLDRMLITGGSFRLIRNDVILASTNEVSFLARQINLVKNSKEDPIGYTYGDVKFALSDVKLYSETGLYNISLDKFTINKQDSSVVIQGFHMKPKYDKTEFSTKLKTQNDRFDIDIREIAINRIGYRRILEGQPLHLGSVILDSVSADIYRDKNVAFDFNKFPSFYNESFLKVSLPLVIDTFTVTNSLVQYGELAQGRTQAGLIRLEDFSAFAYDLKSKPADDSIDDVMKLTVRARVMGEGPLNAELVMPLEGDLHNIRCSGSVGAMKLSPLNDMLEPSINMKFNGGSVSRMTFDFTANDNSSSGWMEFLYKDIDVSLMKKDPGKEWGFLSFLANTVTLSNNPQPGKDPKIVAIGYERDKNKGIINYIWKTIQSGMIRTIIPVSKYQIDTKQKEKKEKTDSQGARDGKRQKKKTN